MRRSLANLRRSDIRSKPCVKKIKSYKRQKTLTEFKIPTAASLPIRKRDGLKVILNDGDTPIVLDEDEIALDTLEEDGRLNVECQEIERGKSGETVTEETIIDQEVDSVHITDHGESLVSLLESQQSVIEIIESDNETTKEEIQGTTIDEGTMTIDTNTDKTNSIKCPICNIDISELELYAREAHCEQCFEKNLTKEISNKVEFNLKSSPKKQLKENKNNKKKKKKKQRLPLPSIKILNFKSGYKLVVDGFNFAPDPNIEIYFLSHFHSDHYIGINKSWDNGKIYCSIITSQLLRYKFKVPSERIFELENDTWVPITDKIEVMAMDANHCPGASIFLFREWGVEGTIVKQILHTGDFRVTKQLTHKISDVLRDRSINGCKCIDEIYLDTTYLNVGNSHPTQNEVITATAQYIKSYFDELTNKQSYGRSNNILDKLIKHRHDKERKNVVLVGSYSIGKEKLAQGIAKELNQGDNGIYIRETDILRKKFIAEQEQISLSGANRYVDVHIVPLNILKEESKVCKYIKETYCGMTWLDVNLVGIIPTGWTFHGHWGYQRKNIEEKEEIIQKILGDDNYGDHIGNGWFKRQITRRDQKKLKERGKFDIFNIPYSEHSSFPELIQFLSSREICWEHIFPTVNLDKLDDMKEWFQAITRIKEERERK